MTDLHAVITILSRQWLIKVNRRNIAAAEEKIQCGILVTSIIPIATTQHKHSPDCGSQRILQQKNKQKNFSWWHSVQWISSYSLFYVQPPIIIENGGWLIDTSRSWLAHVSVSMDKTFKHFRYETKCMRNIRVKKNKNKWEPTKTKIITVNNTNTNHTTEVKLTQWVREKRERERERECVCVCEREREREREGDCAFDLSSKSRSHRSRPTCTWLGHEIAWRETWATNPAQAWRKSLRHSYHWTTLLAFSS